MGQHHQRQVVVALFERPRKIDLFKAVSCTSRSMLVEVIAQLGVIGFTRGVVALSLTQALVAISVLGAFAFNLPLSVPAPMLLGLAAGAVTASMAAAASVAWRTTRVSPLEALRYEQRSSMRRIR